MTSGQPISSDLEGRIVEVRDLRAEHRDAMHALMERFYADVERATFDEDLEQKRWCLLVLDRKERIRGFSTQRMLETELGGRPVRALFSGDTIIDRDHWGTPALPLAFARLALSLIDQNPDETLYWFLTSKGCRTYRYLPVFFREFYPRWNRPTPAWAQSMIRALASVRYPGAYAVERGVVPASGTGYRVRPVVAWTAGRDEDANVRFFHERNPGHEAGDELCCLAPLTHDNFSAAARRLINSKRFQAIATGWARS